MRFTEQTITKLAPAPDKPTALFFDDALPRFGILTRRTSTGQITRHFLIQIKYPSGVKKFTLARCEETTLKDARDRARDIFELIRKGIDPLAERRRLIANTETEVSFVYAVDQYLKQARIRLRPTSFSNVERYLFKTWQHLNERPVASIRRSDVSRHVEKIESDGHPVAARMAAVHLSTFFRWCRWHDMIESNPCEGAKMPNPPKPRERNLSSAEIVRVWNGCEALAATHKRKGDNGAFARMVQLLLLTGARRAEVAGLTWGEIDLAATNWTLPKERSKNHREHVVPLADAALAVIGDRPTIAGDDTSLFGRYASFSGYSKSKKALDSEIEKEGPIARWTLHDLRRTFATGCAELGVEPHIIEATLNHISGHKGGVAGIYNRASYAEPKRQAMRTWAEHVMSLVGGGEPKVVHLRRAGDTESATVSA